MSDYYKAVRNPGWNYGGPNWKLSRSKIDLFMECPRCFYIDNKLGVSRPRGPSFTLNIAVDELLKKEFDIHRDGQTPHPLMNAYGVKAVPFAHKNMEAWRHNFTGVQYFHEPTGMTISGAVDDIWQDADGNLIIVDYKATSKDGKIETLADSKWEQQYCRQMEVYQWLLRQNGFKVSDTGYFVYVNGKKDRKAFDGKLEFDVTLVSHTGKDDWVEKILFKIKECLEHKKIPAHSKECDFCKYTVALGDCLREQAKANIDVKETLEKAKETIKEKGAAPSKAKRSKKTKEEEVNVPSLFEAQP
jgi:hypothetical protein